MVHFPSHDTHQRLLKTPNLVRVVSSHGRTEDELTLILKCSSLLLKYIIQGCALNLLVFQTSNATLCYAIQVWDDSDTSVSYWSAARSYEEIDLLKRLAMGVDIVAQLFNETCTNVAWRKLSSRAGSSVIEALDGGQPIAGHERDIAPDVHASLDRIYRDSRAAIRFENGAGWRHITSSYITNRFDVSEISFFETDEGNQQEQLARWLVDSLHPAGAIHRPEIHEQSGPKEFTDVLLTYSRGSFVIESKTLAIFARSSLPSREKLARDIQKDVRDACCRQLKTACRKLQQGERIFLKGTETEIEVKRTNPVHAICLVPDLSLLRGWPEFGKELILQFANRTKCFLHVLDPFQSFRIVQAAHMLSDAGRTTTRMMAFDAQLLTRLEFAATVDDADFDMRIDLTSDPPRISFSN